jgi:VanZ family protein
MGKSRLQKFAEFWLPIAGYVALIFSVSSIPQLPSPTQWDYSDKVIHIAEYGVLGWLFHRGFKNSFRFTLRGAVSVMAVSLGLLIGAVDETVQSFVPGRESSLQDLLADLVGLLSAELLLWRAPGLMARAKKAVRSF